MESVVHIDEVQWSKGYHKFRKQDASLEVSYVLKDYKTKEVLMTVELNGEKLVNAEMGEFL